MILFEGATPLNDFIKIIHSTNPDTVGVLTADNIDIGDITTVDPLLNKGKNTRALVRYTGEGETVGDIEVQFDRISLDAVYPSIVDGYLRIEAPQTEDGKTDLNIMEDLVSSALGSNFTAGGAYLDYSCSIPTTYTDKTVDVTLSIGANSLRYVPGSFLLKVLSSGRGLSLVITQQQVFPFKNSSDMITLGGSYSSHAYKLGTGKKFHTLLLETLDFSKAMDGTVYYLSSANKFDPEKLRIINLILSTHGLPPIPEDTRLASNYSSYGKSTRSAGKYNAEVANKTIALHSSTNEVDYAEWANMDFTGVAAAYSFYLNYSDLTEETF